MDEIVALLNRPELSASQLRLLAVDIIVGDVLESDYRSLIGHESEFVRQNAKLVLNCAHGIENK